MICLDCIAEYEDDDDNDGGDWEEKNSPSADFIDEYADECNDESGGEGGINGGWGGQEFDTDY